MVAGLVAALGGGSAVALSACSDDDVLGNDDDGRVSVSLTERDLKPGRVEVAAGKVEFEVQNDGDRLHAFAVETTTGVKTIKEIKPGDSENLSVDLSDGRYRMYDPRGGYRERGVRGTVVVRSDETDTVTERTVERTVIDEEPDVVVPETDDPEVQDPELQDPPAQPAPRPAQPAPPPAVTQTVTAPPPAETTP
ncbi:MAG: cupredoxin domain-containing protein [Actinomycetota bacterium]|nr:cupredoxin domain-containing protein [Actinomycetota bacterium]